MVNCGACGKFLSPKDAATCGTCPVKYHRACVGISDKAHISKDWICPNCKRGIRKGDNSQTPVKALNEDAVSDASPGLTRLGDKCLGESVTSLGLEENTVPSLKEFMQEFSQGLKEMREFRTEMALLRQTVSNLALRMGQVEQRLETLERGHSEKGMAGTGELEKAIVELKQELNDRDQEALLADVEIGALPEQKGESTFHTVCVLATRLGVPLEERDVVFAERVGPRPEEAGGRPRRLVVRLARRHLRDELLRAARVRRAGLAGGAGERVYINERLTRLNRQLFYRVREECRKLQWRYRWTRRGRIFARQGDGLPVYQFRCDEDIARAFGTGSQTPV